MLVKSSIVNIVCNQNYFWFIDSLTVTTTASCRHEKRVSPSYVCSVRELSGLSDLFLSCLFSRKKPLIWCPNPILVYRGRRSNLTYPWWMCHSHSSTFLIICHSLWEIFVGVLVTLHPDLLMYGCSLWMEFVTICNITVSELLLADVLKGVVLYEKLSLYCC